jgi:hypothetical protein
MSADETGADEGHGGETSASDGSVAGECGGHGSHEQRPMLSPVAKSSLLWGVVGGLCFLVLIQGYELLADQRVSVLVKFAVAVLVGVAAGGSTYAVQRGLPAENESA